MSAFVLIPGAGGAAWYWHRVQLRARGHEAVAVDLPGADESAGLPEYADTVVAAIDGRRDHRVGRAVDGRVHHAGGLRPHTGSGASLVNAMIPLPGETPGDWSRRGRPSRRLSRRIRSAQLFPSRRACGRGVGGEAHGYAEADIAFSQPCAIERWPDVPTRVLAGRDDRFFPLEFQRRTARNRLGLNADVVPGGHLAALSRPAELAGRLARYLDEAAAPPGD